jgi:hypothetical protein
MRACGRIALAVDNAILPYVEPIVAKVEQLFAARARRASTSTSSAALYDTIGMLSCAVGAELEDVVDTLIDEMLDCELSSSIIAALSEISRHMPAFKSKIQGT